MKRAEVWRDRSTVSRSIWCAGVCHWRDRAVSVPIPERHDYMDTMRIFPTHATALAHALEAVGLSTPEQHREAP